MGYFDTSGWIYKTPEHYLSKVSQPFVLMIDQDVIIPDSPGSTGVDILRIPAFHCSGKVLSKSDSGKRVKISGRFFYKDCEGEMLLFYDEGDGNPPFTYFNKP